MLYHPCIDVKPFYDPKNSLLHPILPVLYFTRCLALKHCACAHYLCRGVIGTSWSIGPHRLSVCPVPGSVLRWFNKLPSRRICYKGASPKQAEHTSLFIRWPWSNGPNLFSRILSSFLKLPIIQPKQEKKTHTSGHTVLTLSSNRSQTDPANKSHSQTYWAGASVLDWAQPGFRPRRGRISILNPCLLWEHLVLLIVVHYCWREGAGGSGNILKCIQSRNGKSWSRPQRDPEELWWEVTASPTDPGHSHAVSKWRHEKKYRGNMDANTNICKLLLVLHHIQQYLSLGWLEKINSWMINS